MLDAQRDAWTDASCRHTSESTRAQAIQLAPLYELEAGWSQYLASESVTLSPKIEISGFQDCTVARVTDFAVESLLVDSSFRDLKQTSRNVKAGNWGDELSPRLPVLPPTLLNQRKMSFKGDVQ
ncbi:uncharacterized protein PHALS_13947 [Plasmopara halstedii]|uniref:Uncharacterized protein n=1 Tax=Plasmopara halstedii TaxID=4781 RepID=A0A0P1AQ12_PLAHL|nr:uncharacterized protein PHALS_13947 [Plasmopara halstedii]CEG43649.1 hypothetical protein PHALS_13947 [Plasmopara halstedii]|eukprot:XP_024580018.1 hypothetical protein PHALS_13947 [Plasmopara halstedii]